ncbi:short-chain fatty acyl-CoA regulator family protein [Mesorhizobium sp. ZMM04-5]|uniref:Short-chain fatty acyl-CoA regulator family protein n=1 Tax=Mesorhizobium marinum TaxID=3228790 RepID=A0ABV3R342_9HYPH
MADQKIFAGPRIRRMRMERGLTQTAMAEGLGISPSYLNLIERNQRPITVQLILKLASVYAIDPQELQGETRGSVAALKEVFSDPLLAGELPGDQELIDLAETAPNAAAAMQKLFRAYREQAERLSDLNALLAGQGRGTTLSAARLPVDEVSDVFERRPWHFAALEEAAESFHGELAPGDDLFAALKAWLRKEHGISVRPLPAATMPNWRRRYDRHSQRLFLSERLSRADQLREVAMEACLIRMGEVLASEVAALKLSSDEARRLARFELARYAGLALMMPYAAVHQAAGRARHDVAVLAARFGVSFEQAATRLVSLQRTSSAGVPFFLMEIDGAGNRLRRVGANGFPHAAFGGGCPKLPVHEAFADPGRVLAEAVEMPDGASLLLVARTIDGPQAGFDERPRRTAILLGCDLSFRDQTVYGAALAATPPTPIGPACRLCERAGCLARAEPPVTRPLGLDEMVTGLSAFDFQ